MNTIYNGSIALSKLQSVKMEVNGKSGKVKGIFIPFDVNFIEVKEDAIYLPVRILIRDEPDQYKQDGFIAQTAPSSIYKAATAEEKEAFNKLPILGNIKNFGSNAPKNDSAGLASDECLTPDDDLPF